MSEFSLRKEVYQEFKSLTLKYVKEFTVGGIAFILGITKLRNKPLKAELTIKEPKNE